MRPPDLEASQPARVPSRRVLVVDDNIDVTDTICEVLEMSGHVTKQAGDGPTALSIAAEFRPDVVLLDVGLPGMDGLEVARQLRMQPGGDHVVIVVITGWGQPDDLTRSKEAGVDHHLVKPVGLEQLRALVGAPAAPR